MEISVSGAAAFRVSAGPAWRAAGEPRSAGDDQEAGAAPGGSEALEAMKSGAMAGAA
jgi:hypothetical protein